MRPLPAEARRRPRHRGAAHVLGSPHLVILARFGASALALLALVACDAGETGPAVRPPPVMVEPVVGSTLEERIEATGQLMAVDEASVAAEVSGRLTAVLVPEGAAVVAGDVVLEIDRERRELALDNERALVAEARAAIAEAEREVARGRRLQSRQAASKARLEDAETALQRARARHLAAEAKRGLAERALRDASVTAPFDGLIARRYVSVGDYVAQGEKLYDLVALNPIEVEFRLTERDSGRVELGDPVAVRVASHPDEVFVAHVNVVSPRIDPATRTLRVKALLENTDGRLRPGLFARADLGVAEREDVAMIPEEAILRRSDGAIVYVLDGSDRVQRRQIRTGIYRDGRVEVVSGVRVGEWVVVRGQARLVDGSVVELRGARGEPVALAPRGEAVSEAGDRP